MAVEAKRGCGYRKAGGLYLVGGGLTRDCDRMPIPITPCPVCGEVIRFHRAVAQINPLRLWAPHIYKEACRCERDCPACSPSERAWLMWVGTEYTPQSFIHEARELGVSKRIARVPKAFALGDWVFLAHNKAINAAAVADIQLLAGLGQAAPAPAVFLAFCPERVEKIVTESQARDAEAMDKLLKAGITPVKVPDDDADHNPRGWG